MQKESPTIFNLDINRINFERIRSIKDFMYKVVQLRFITFWLAIFVTFGVVFFWLHTTSLWWNIVIFLSLSFVLSILLIFPVACFGAFILKYLFPVLCEDFFRAKEYIDRIEAKGGFIWHFITSDLEEQAKIGKSELERLKEQSMYGTDKEMDYLTYYEVVEFLHRKTVDYHHKEYK